MGRTTGNHHDSLSRGATILDKINGTFGPHLHYNDAKMARFSLRAEQGWRSGESARLPPMCPAFDSRTRRHMRVEFVVGSLPCSERFFSGSSGFPLSSKTNVSKFQFDLELSSTSGIMSLWLG